MIIDIHAHLMKYEHHLTPQAKAFAEDMAKPFGVTPQEYFPDADKIVKDMNDGGVDIAVVHGVDFERTQGLYQPPEDLANEVKKYPDRLIGFWAPDPFRTTPYDAAQRLEYVVKELGMKGCGEFGPPYCHFYANDERVFPIYEKCIELDIPILIHNNWTPEPTVPLKYAWPVWLDDVPMRFPKLKIILAHLGGPWITEAAYMAMKHKNMYVDFAGWGPNMVAPISLYTSLLKFRSLMRTSERILGVGTDYPLCKFKPVVDVIKSFPELAEKRGLPMFSDKEIAGILGDNAAKLLKLQ